MRKQIKAHPRITLSISLLIALTVLVLIGGYKLNWAWTGFNGTDKTDKTLYDWLNLLGVLAIPIVVGLGAAWYTAQQGKVSERESTDNQRENALQTYFDKMSELLLKEHLGERTADGKLNPEYEQVRRIARIRTITVLNQLDARRIGYVFAFLSEADLMLAKTKEPTENAVSLFGADLHAVNWSQANLSGADLSGVNLSGADLSGADFMNANLSEAILLEANLSRADFLEANLCNAHLNGADLSGTYLYKADLTRADFGEIFYGGAFFSEARRINSANLSKANLSGANLSGANLRGVDLSGADLTKVIAVSNEELERQAKSLKGATLPNGSIHP